MLKKEAILEVNGLVIKTNSIYKVTHKPDSSAPSGFIKEGATKLPSAGVANTVPCRFAITNKSSGAGVYDTGLYEESPCYANMDKTKVRALINKLNKLIVTPYERAYGLGVLDQKNINFWDDFGVTLEEGRIFSTYRVEDLLELYIAMRGYDLTPRQLLGNPSFRHSQYCIEDKEEVQSIKDERAIDKFNSIKIFGALLDADRASALNILRYNNVIGISADIQDPTLISLFSEWVEQSQDNPKKFQKTYDLTQDKKTSDVVELYVVLNRLAQKNIITKISGEYNYKGTILGVDLKTAALTLSKDKDLQEVKIELFEIEI